MKSDLLHSLSDSNVLLPGTEMLVWTVANQLSKHEFGNTGIPFANYDQEVLKELFINRLSKNVNELLRRRKALMKRGAGSTKTLGIEQTSATMIFPHWLRWLREMVFKETVRAFAARLDMPYLSVRKWQSSCASYPSQAQIEKIWDLWEKARDSGVYRKPTLPSEKEYENPQFEL